MASTGRLPRLVVLDDYQNVALSSADWSVLDGQVLGIDVINEALGDDESIVTERLKDYEIICAMRERTKFPASVLERLPKLKLLVTTGMRNRSLDVSFALSRGIVVSGTTSDKGGGKTTVEHIFALIFATARHIVEEDQNIKARKPQWQSAIPLGLEGKTLGLLGLGRLGSQVAKIAKVFDMRVLAWSPNLTPERAAAAGVAFAPSKSALFSSSDIISIHLVSAPSTRGIVSQNEFTHMKPTAYLINTSRGPIVDEIALLDALNQGKIAGAGLDVYDKEPMPLDHPIRDAKNVTLSPHNAYVSDDSYKAWFTETAEDVFAYLEGRPKRLLTE